MGCRLGRDRVPVLRTHGPADRLSVGRAVKFHGAQATAGQIAQVALGYFCAVEIHGDGHARFRMTAVVRQRLFKGCTLETTIREPRYIGEGAERLL